MTTLAFDRGPLGGLPIGDLEVIEMPEEPAPGTPAPPSEPLRWLIGEGSPAQAAFARNERDGTGSAGLWQALEALTGLGSGPSGPATSS